jgi:hypothetical protein
MHRVHLLAASVAVIGVLVALPATAAASTSYTLTGVEVNASPATFVGSLVGRLGVWEAVVLHDPLDYSSGSTTAINGGSFTITTFVPPGQATGSIDGGTIVAGPPVTSSNGFACTQTFALGGTLNQGTGSYAGVLTHYGYLSGGRCNALAASFAGRATL